MPSFGVSHFVHLEPSKIESYSLQEILDERNHMQSDDRWWNDGVDECCDVEEWKRSAKEYGEKGDGYFKSLHEYRITLLKNKHFYNYSYNISRRMSLNRKLKKVKRVS